MDGQIAFIGFGEAGQAFVPDTPDAVRAFDIKTDAPSTRDAKLADYSRTRVIGEETPTGALAGAEAVLCVVTADQALVAARRCAPLLTPGALWFDMNSVAPKTKREAAAAIEVHGGRYVDVAVMAPVLPLRLHVPLLIGGPHAVAGTAALAAMGFTGVSTVTGEIGAVSAIKMIRSVMVKGLEALTTECVLAAQAAGVRDDVIRSLNASWPDTDWAVKADYNLDRMMVHGLRRAAEMEEVVKTLDALGTGTTMTRGTVERQRAMGSLGLTPAATLDAKLAQLHPLMKDRAV